jgi:hypothetical protein
MRKERKEKDKIEYPCGEKYCGKDCEVCKQLKRKLR